MLDLDRLWQEAVKDDFGTLVPSDVRQLIGELRAARAAVARVGAVCDSQEPRHGLLAAPVFCDYHCVLQTILEVRAALTAPKRKADTE